MATSNYQERSLSDEDDIARLIKAAQKLLESSYLDTKEANLIKSKLRSILLDCQVADEMQNNAVFDLCCSIANAAYRIGLTTNVNDAAKILQKEANRRAGASSGIARRKIAELGWKSHAAELARSARKDQPKYSQKELVVEMRDRWCDPLNLPPKFDTLLNFVRFLERSGALASRAKV